MAIITFLSDFGDSDHYVAAVKATILSANPHACIIDISHQVQHCDIAHGAYILKAVFRDFPKGTIHIVAVNSTGQRGDRHLAVKLEGHYFVGADNGFFGLISDQEAEYVADINTEGQVSTFPTKTILAPAAVALAEGKTIETLGHPTEGFKKMIGRHLKANKRLMSGHVIRVDHFGNLITNIDKATFELLSQQKNYNITFSRENSRRIHANPHSVEAGDLFTLFNDQGLLEIGINQGHAAELLGMTYDSTVMVIFDERRS